MAKTTTHTVTEECDATMGGQAITGWIIRRRDGEPAYFQIKGRSGLCVPIEKVVVGRPVSPAEGVI